MANNDLSELPRTRAVRCIAALLMIVCFVYHALFLCFLVFVGISIFSIPEFSLPQALDMIGREFVWILLSVILSIWAVSRTLHSYTFRSKSTVIILSTVLGLSFLNYFVLHPTVREWANGESPHKIGL